MPELGHLRAFVAVAQQRSFTQAAQRLHLAQQAVSRSVATLESQLGVTLLERTTREVTLTEAGEALLRSGGDALQRVDAAFAEATAFGEALVGTLRVGVTPAVGTAVHPGIAAALTTGRARVRVAVATVIGSGGPPTLTDDQFAVRPAGWPVADAVALELGSPGLELPLWVHWPAGAVQPAVRRLREHLT